MKRAVFSVGVALACFATLTGCNSGDDAAPKRAPSTTTTTAAPKSVFDGMVPVGDGRQLRARCLGSGTPTVLLEVGGSGDMTDWSSEFVNLLAAGTTTCLYSRAGGRGSTAVDGGLTRAQLVSDADAMRAFLHTEHGVDGPYVLVGWSLGGAVVLAEALAHPDTTAGMVILDSDFPADFKANCRAAGRDAADCQEEYDGDKEAKALEEDILRQFHSLPNTPVSVVSALQLPDCHLEAGTSQVEADIGGTKVTAADCKALGVAIADKMRTDWSRLGPQVTHSTVDVDHDGMTDRAASELAAIVLKLVAAKR